MTSDFRVRLLAKHPWLTFVLPYLVYMLVGAFEPAPPGLAGKTSWINMPYAWYPAIYSIKLLFTLAAMAVVWPGYRAIPFRAGLAAIGVGAVGVLLWVGLCNLKIEEWIVAQEPVKAACHLVGMSDTALGVRPSFDPFTRMGRTPALMYTFLAVRFFGLAIVVPVMEEFLLRGFAMRFVMADRWWEVPLGRMNGAAVAVSLALPALTHPPTEFLAALAWFGMVTWFYWRTRSLWNCVVAHGVTNLLLGVYILATGSWWLW